ncbi:threonine dehydratase I [Choiromyces venosus 120613-1]|uniref:Threonine dehydratase n=1 Tax=Choiromyces venosus 120613-1 TaxID=1336337 RepID=A0A3N4JGM2_9PEZI|nr:threonine dehydratase I [Choiromyces venosus 120613-1]
MTTTPNDLTANALTEYSSSAPDKGSGRSSPVSSVPSVFKHEDGSPDYLRLILTSRVYDVVKETPVTPAVNTSAVLGCKVILKREDLQPVFSFKLRGAYNKMAHLPVEERWKGVIACSAGNHAQGVAYAAKHLGIPATIVMPTATPAIKHQNSLEVKYGLTNVAPFDDPYVIAGQGTIGMELLRQCNLENLKAVFCCVGGGGLIAGVGVYIKRLAPHVKVIGVETLDANAMVSSLRAGERVTLKEVGLFADGAAVKVVGKETFRVCKECVDEVIEVSTDEICAAIKDVFVDTRSIVEPAGALALAGLKKYIAANPPNEETDTLCAILSGANMDFDRLRFVAERARLGEGKEVFLSIAIPEKPRAFLEMMQCILPRSVTEFSYRLGDSKLASIFMSIIVQDRTLEIPGILGLLRDKGYYAEDISDNEMAKSHIRYLIGGRLPDGCDSEERMYRFEFPERPRALEKFLKSLHPDFNISLFHYRNQGGDIGKVLAGIQVPNGKRADLEAFLVNLKYPFVDETENAVYQKFMTPIAVKLNGVGL